MKHLGRIISLTFIVIVTTIVLANVWIISSTQSFIYQSVDDIEGEKVALVLGTSKYRVGGGLNPYFENRINAAVDLYKAGKVKHIIVSGDNSTAYYNEPKTMMEDLVKLGVPDKDITLDHRGLRTLDSVVRCKEIFGQQRFIIVTQEFHNYRALFISQYYNLDAIGYAAKDISPEGSAIVTIREYLARPLALLDLYFLGTTPELSDDKQEINI